MRLKAEDYGQRFRDRHLPDGMVVSLRYRSIHSKEVISYENLENSAAWTGLYLGSCVYRWMVLRESENLKDIRMLLTGLNRAVQSTGRSGVIPRFVGKAEDSLYREAYSRFRGEDRQRLDFGRLAFRGEGKHANLVWLGGANREDYAGVNWGLSSLLYYTRDPEIVSQVSNIVVRVVSRLEQDSWRLNDGKDEPSFIDPVLVTAWLRTAALIDPKKYSEKYNKQVTELLGSRKSDFSDSGICRYGDPTPAFFRLANLIALNQNEMNHARHLIFQEMISKVQRQSQAVLNPWPALAYLESFTSSRTDSTTLAILQGLLYEYPSPPRWSASVNLSENGEIDQINANGERWTRYAQLISKRPSVPFLWSYPSTRTVGGVDEPVVYPGLDFLLAYWMARHFGVTPGEDLGTPITPMKPRKFSGPSIPVPALQATNRPVVGQ
ncbi:MAG: hypothetical protein EXS25_12710 [Pedosphaera sp.]|nr:hypothetical protein [Pedosphaera sp.]